MERLLRVGLLLGSTALALGLAELAVRIVAPQHLIIARPDVWQAADTLGHHRRPNVRTTMNVGVRTVNFVTDGRGFRIGVDGPVRGVQRILLLGDSFMEAREVEHEESLAGLLESRLAAHLGWPVAVSNAGVSDWEPSHYLLQARSVLSRDTMDLVLVSVCLGNDIVPRRVERFPPRVPRVRNRLRFPYALSWREFVKAVLYPINDLLEERSELFLFVKYRLHDPLMEFGLTADYFPVSLLRRTAESPSWRTTSEVLADIDDLARRHGAEALFLLLPAVQQVDSSVASRFLAGFDIAPDAIDIDQPTRIMKAKLAARGLTVLDPLTLFRGRHADGVQLYEVVGWHLTAAGHDALAAVTAPAVEDILRRRHLADSTEAFSRPRGAPAR